MPRRRRVPGTANHGRRWRPTEHEKRQPHINDKQEGGEKIEKAGGRQELPNLSSMTGNRPGSSEAEDGSIAQATIEKRPSLIRLLGALWEAIERTDSATSSQGAKRGVKDAKGPKSKRRRRRDRRSSGNPSSSQGSPVR